MTTTIEQTIRAWGITAGDRIRYRYKERDHWSMPATAVEEMGDGTVRVHLPFGFTMRYRRKERVVVRRGS